MSVYLSICKSLLSCLALNPWVVHLPVSALLMSVCVCMCLCLSVCVCMCLCVSLCLCVSICVCLYLSVSVQMTGPFHAKRVSHETDFYLVPTQSQLYAWQYNTAILVLW